MKESLRQTPRVLVRKVLKIENGELVRFAEATDIDNPIYKDVAVAKQNGYKDLVALPTFVDYFHCNDEVLKQLEIDEQRLTLCTQEVEWLRPLYAGDEVEVVVTLVESNEVRNEKSSFVKLSIETIVTRKDAMVLKGLRGFLYNSTSSR